MRYDSPAMASALKHGWWRWRSGCGFMWLSMQVYCIFKHIWGKRSSLWLIAPERKAR